MSREEIVLQLTLAVLEKHTFTGRNSDGRHPEGEEAAQLTGENVAKLFNTIWNNLTDGDYQEGDEQGHSITP
jgi:hypothetical protein